MMSIYLCDRNSLCEQLKFVTKTFNKILDKKDSEVESLREKIGEMSSTVEFLPMRTTVTEEFFIPVKDV